MAFRSTNILPEAGYKNARLLAVNIKNRSIAARTKMAAGNTSFETIWDLRKQLFQAHTTLGTFAVIPGIVQYARDQEDDPTYDIAAEFIALRAAIDDARSTIDLQLPADGNNWLLISKIGVGTELDIRTFTIAQTATIRTKLQVIEDAVV